MPHQKVARENHTRAELEAIVAEANDGVDDALDVYGKGSRQHGEALFAKRHYASRLERLVESEAHRARFDGMDDREVGRRVAEKIWDR